MSRFKKNIITIDQYLIKAIQIFFLLLCVAFFFCGSEVYASQKIVYHRRVIATKDANGVITFNPSGGDDHDALNYLLDNDNRKFVVFPKGKTIKISRPIYIGSNTMLNATGARIIQTDREYGVLKNEVDATNYNSAHNITIVGGTWENKYNTESYTAARFAHARNLKFKNMTIIANYQCHCLELIACKDVKVYNCKLIESNSATRTSTSVEDALQIDVATPRTAPGVLYETGSRKYVNGQTCQNIRVEKCTIYGSRGICANYARYESQFHNKYHKNITIYKCKITGTTSQGVALYNTINAVVKNNYIKTTSHQMGQAYPSALHLQLFGKSSGGKNVIARNQIYGMIHGILIDTTYSSARYRATQLIGNKIYAKTNMQISITRGGAISKNGNKMGRW